MSDYRCDICRTEDEQCIYCACAQGHDIAAVRRAQAAVGQPPFTNIDHLGRGDHNPPIGSLATAIESLQPLAQQGVRLIDTGEVRAAPIDPRDGFSEEQRHGEMIDWIRAIGDAGGEDGDDVMTDRVCAALSALTAERDALYATLKREQGFRQQEFESLHRVIGGVKAERDELRMAITEAADILRDAPDNDSACSDRARWGAEALLRSTLKDQP